MDYLGDEGQVSITQQLRARDTAQREALAQLEAKHATWMDQYDSVVRYGNELLAERDTAQAQLAESLGLLRYSQEISRLFDDEHTAEVGRFLARHAQAEQQEAQGAQAGDERAAFEEWAKDRSWFDPRPSRKERDDSLFFYEDAITDHNWIAWQARAALATQPAVPVEYPAGAIENGRTLMGRLEQWYTFADDQGHALAMCKEWLDLKECFEQMADSLNAVRGAEHDQ